MSISKRLASSLIVVGASVLAGSQSLAQYNPRALLEPQAPGLVAEPDQFIAQWPLQVAAPAGQITIYQPQMESLEGVTLSARSAVSVARPGAEPVFGVVWFKGRIQTDRESQTVQVQDVTITQTRIPEGDAGTEQAVREAISRSLASPQAKLPYDTLVAMLETRSPDQAALKFDAPRVIFMDRPAIKVQYDGEPRLLKMNDSIERVANTPFFVVKDPASGTFFLKGGGVWYDAPDPKGQFRRSSRVPQAIINLADQSGYKDPQEPLPAEQLERLEIITATEPTELIWTDGAPQMAAVPGTGLLYVTNTDSNVFVDVQTQRTYVLLSGRWFEAPNRSGPWAFVPPGNLPAEFSKIPAESERGEVLVHIAGTPQAKQAVAEAQIPRTAAVDRNNFQQPKIQYDGDPFFEPIQGTSMTYARNSAQSVVRVGDTYYACYDAVWYQSASPNGPWELCTELPTAINDIPPSSPVYPTKYVQVYDYDDEYVYTGYTPGYTGTYAYDGAVVYGTGYYYDPWWGYNSYYPRAYTYGFGAHYNGYDDSWGFSFGYGWGGGSLWLGYNSGYYGWCDPWFGYAGYYPYYSYGYRHYPYRYDYHHHHNDHHDYHGDHGGHNDGHRDSSWSQNEANARDNRDSDRVRRADAFGNERNATASREGARSANVYDRRSDVRRTSAEEGRRTASSDSFRTLESGRSAGQPPRSEPEARRGARNDVVADRSGRVFRQSEDGNWQLRENGRWQSEGRSPQALASEPAAQRMNRDASRAAARDSRTADIRSQNPGTPRVRPDDVRVSTPSRDGNDLLGRTRSTDRAPVVTRAGQRETPARNPTALSAPSERTNSDRLGANRGLTERGPSNRVEANSSPRSSRPQVLENSSGRSAGQPPLASSDVVREWARSAPSERSNAGGQGSNRFGRTEPQERAPTREAPAPRASSQSRAQPLERSTPPLRAERSAPPPSRMERSAPAPRAERSAPAPRMERSAPAPRVERSAPPMRASPGGPSFERSAPRSSPRAEAAPRMSGSGGGRSPSAGSPRASGGGSRR